LDWYDIWLGALVTSVFFELGKSAIGFYIGKQGLESTYGAAASIIVVLIWVYYSSQIVLMGAEITHAIAKHRLDKSPRTAWPINIAVRWRKRGDVDAGQPTFTPQQCQAANTELP
jgi:uncharacterized BrkB/YihY/UPF0761 family membrane protein